MTLGCVLRPLESLEFERQLAIEHGKLLEKLLVLRALK